MIEKQYLLDCLFKVIKMPLHVLNKDGVVLYTASSSEEDLFKTDSQMCIWIVEKSGGKTGIFHEGQAVYGAFWHESSCYIIGPCTTGIMDFSFRHEFARRHALKAGKINLLEVTYTAFTDVLILLFHMITGEKINAAMIVEDSGEEQVHNPVSEKEEFLYKFEHDVQEQKHFSFETEREIFQKIREGAPIIWDENTDFSQLENVGKMAVNDYKKLEYMEVTSITLATRAAIDGGVPVSEAYDLSDLYLQKLERCRNQSEILKLHFSMMQDFSRRVALLKKAQRQERDYIERCKNSLVKNVHHRVKLADIAEMLGVNPSYLSRKFSEEVGMTIVQYLTRERLRGAANMLKYSDYTCAEIADYFCFSSQSRFGELFKNAYGVTPAQYRRENQIMDFKM